MGEEPGAGLTLPPARAGDDGRGGLGAGVLLTPLEALCGVVEDAQQQPLPDARGQAALGRGAAVEGRELVASAGARELLEEPLEGVQALLRVAGEELDVTEAEELVGAG